jgi:hypothetical protein
MKEAFLQRVNWKKREILICEEEIQLFNSEEAKEIHEIKMKSKKTIETSS